MNPDQHSEYLRRQGQRATTPQGTRTNLAPTGAWSWAVPAGFVESALPDILLITAAEAEALREWVAR